MTGLAGLTTLSLLSFALRLPRLLTRLMARWVLSAPGQRFNLATEPFDMVQRSRLFASLLLTLPGLARTQALLCLVHLLAQLFETLADALFCSICVGVHSSP